MNEHKIIYAGDLSEGDVLITATGIEHQLLKVSKGVYIFAWVDKQHAIPLYKEDLVRVKL